MGMWVQQVSAWKQMENWRAKQQAISDQMDELAALTDSFSTAGANYYTELSNISGQAALKRVTEEAAAKRAEAVAASEKAARHQAEVDAVNAKLKVPEYVRHLKGVNIKV